MNILDYGEVVPCRNIMFEDNKIDVKLGHPGIVILPTSENEEEAYCLYMTSNKARAKREKNKYVKFDGKLPKESYVNLQHIVQKRNIMEQPLTTLSEEKFLSLIKKFYNYQINMNQISNEFNNIQKQVKTLIELLEINEELEVHDKSITRKQIDVLTQYEDEKRMKAVYKAYLMTKNTINRQNMNGLKEDIYTQKLIAMYQRIQNLNFERVDISDPNNDIRKEYINFKNNNYVVSADIIFNDILSLLQLDEKNNTIKSTKVSEFISAETIRTFEKKEKKLQKIRNNYKNRRLEAINRVKEAEERKRRNMYKKYGEIDETFMR